MENKILDVWRLLWPDGVPASEYERALAVTQLADGAPPVPRQIFPPTSPPKARELSTIKAAKLLGVSRSYIQKMVARGELKPTQNFGFGQGMGYRFARADIEAIYNKQRNGG